MKNHELNLQLKMVRNRPPCLFCTSPGNAIISEGVKNAAKFADAGTAAGMETLTGTS